MLWLSAASLHFVEPLLPAASANTEPRRTRVSPWQISTHSQASRSGLLPLQASLALRPKLLEEPHSYSCIRPRPPARLFLSMWQHSPTCSGRLPTRPASFPHRWPPTLPSPPSLALRSCSSHSPQQGQSRAQRAIAPQPRIVNGWRQLAENSTAASAQQLGGAFPAPKCHACSLDARDRTSTLSLLAQSSSDPASLQNRVLLIPALFRRTHPTSSVQSRASRLDPPSATL
mmetsp:Transcript_8174/g.19201  ORF Transcript_8174/g.19201 Transcript_8174/m.19201 type:complete len:230 (-) Transcript_8174:842-1531(-)